MPNPGGAEQPGDLRLPAAEAVRDETAPVSEPAHEKTIAGKTGRAVAAIDIAAGTGAAQPTDVAPPTVSGRGDGVAAVPDTQAPAPAPWASRASAPKQQRQKDAEATAGRQPYNAVTATPRAISLDDEIKLLRRALIGKLRQQNAQLKSMLERFDR
ncbi:hypothetical protein [Agrobacterium tumefaciens]|uniref:hypothetical protein n=1 Tax=Agrobacterium tumefaciens TaxID=358 RepID=UPI001574D6CF|nr:hypothetical protein [Agrobacterium tumefaciens]